MGGRAGHMSHLYDNPELSFSEMKDIFLRAAAGKIEGTEKTDGQNIYISYSVQSGEAKAIRNKSHEQQGGLSPSQLIRYFTSDRVKAGKSAAPETVVNAFINAMSNFEQFAQTLSPNKQIEFFGSDANIFYNAEIMDPQSENVISYDTDTLLIHRVGHAILDKNVGELVKRDTEKSENFARFIESEVEKIENESSNMRSKVKVNALRTLEAMVDNSIAEIAIDNLVMALREVSIDIEQKVGEYIVARLDRAIDKLVDISEETKEMFIKRLIGAKGVTVHTVLKTIPKEQRRKQHDDIIKSVIKDSKTLLKNAIKPIEIIVHNFAVGILSGVESAFIVNHSEAVESLKNKVTKARDNIEAAADENKFVKLQQELNKLREIDTAIEGFVFDYKGHTYKLTGNFAPINQILGMMTYEDSRVAGKTPTPIKALSESSPFPVHKKRHVALIAGGFKPPTRAHLDMIRHYDNAVGADGMVKIYMGTGASSKRKSKRAPSLRTIGDKPVTYDISAKIWEVYFNEAGLDSGPGAKIELIRVDGSPMAPVIDYVTHTAEPDNEIVHLAAGEKDAGRYEKMITSEKLNPRGVDIDITEFPTVRDTNGNVISASNMREAVANEDKETFLNYVPDIFNNEEKHAQLAERVWNILTGELSESLFKLVESVMNMEKPASVLDKIENYIDKVSFGIWEAHKGVQGISSALMSGVAYMSGEITEEDKQIVDAVLIPIQQEIDAFLQTQDYSAFFNTIEKIVDQYYEGEQDINEISSSGGGSIEIGGNGGKKKRKKKTMIREEDNDGFIKEVLNYLVTQGQREGT